MELLIPIVLALLASTASGQQPTKPILPASQMKVAISDSPDALKSISGLQVIAEALDDESKAAGLDRVAITTRVELALRRNGIRVYTKDEMLKTAGKSVLYVTVNVFGPNCIARLQCNQNVISIVNPNVVIVGAAIWLKASSGGSGRSVNMLGVDLLVDAFCNDFLTANPK